MTLFSQTFLLCLFVILSLEFLDSILAAKFHRNGNASNDSGTSDGAFQKQDIRFSDAMLLSAGNEHGTEDGEDVILSGTGPINLTLTHEMLEFEVCKSCMGTSTVCYEASHGLHVLKAVGDCRVSSSCEFKVNGEDQKIFFGEDSVFKNHFVSPCSSTTKMEYPVAHFLSLAEYESCEPKMDDNKMIKLYVNITKGCSIKVKGAKIHVPEISTTPIPLPQRPGKSQKDTSEASSFPDWGYIIIEIVILIAIAAIIGFIVYYLYKKHQTSKRVSPNVAETKPKATVSEADIAADVKTPTKKNDDLEAVKVEQTQMPKKEKKPKTLEPIAAEDVPENKNKKKTKTLEPKTTEDAPAPAPPSKEPAPTSKEPAPASKEPAPTEHKPTPTSPTACYPQVKRLIPRGMKSAKSDSLDGTLKKDKRAMVESFIVSAENLCPKTDASEIFDEIKADYPDIQHEVLASEITLLCLPVSLMFAEMNRLVNASMRKLFAVGCKFGAHIFKD
uniref:Uncharacterized protein n=1 Tax=Panagrolaimus davidi TaxID=227884 RepID=A0A914NZ07_9BILA